MKKKIVTLGLVLTATSALALSAACGFHGADNTLDANDAFGLGAVSTVKLMGAQLSAKAIGAFAAGTEATNRESEPLTESDEVKTQAEKFNEYFTALDSFLGENVVSTSTSANTDEKYPYETKMTISGRDVEGNSDVYTMYYKETLVRTDFDDDDDETESVYSLEGVLVLDNRDYFLTGIRSSETERDETENELVIRAYADKNDRMNYIQMAQETSEEIENNKTEYETEYIYSVYENGKLVEATAVEFETERKANGKEETEYELEFRTGDAKGRYKVVREKTAEKTEIKVKYKINGKNGVFSIREIVDGNGEKHYEYTFSDNTKLVL